MSKNCGKAFIISLLITVALPLITGCAVPKEAPLVSATPLPSPSPLPIAKTDGEGMLLISPESSETPVATPKIQAEWYVQRTEQMEKWMRAYGNFSTDAEIAAAVSRMEIDPDKPMVALTFDDGPMAGITDQIVDILYAHNARATFFVRGGRCKFEETPGLLKKILGAGSEIGNHTWKHEILTCTNTKQMMNSIQRCNEDVFDATGYTITLLRPPGGKSNPEVCRVAKKFGMPVVLWAQSGNVHEHDPEKIAENVRRQIVNGKALEDGDIILLHDTKPYMVDAVKIIVPQLQQMGYQLVTAGELIHLSDRGFVPGEEYKKRFS